MSTRRKRVLYIYRVGWAAEPHSGLKRELMKLAFSTLGCPDWDVLRIAETAERLGYQGVELRAVSGSLDLLERPEFTAAQIKSTLSQFEDRNIEVCCVDTSCAFHSRDQRERSTQVDVAVAHAQLAA